MNHCTEAGAEALAKRIRNYWAARGCDINVWTVKMVTRDSEAATAWCVRSDTVNGLPRPLLRRAA